MSLTKEELISALKQVKRKEFGKQYHTFEINIYEMTSDIIDYLESIPIQYEWIQCEEKLPEHFVIVLVTYIDKRGYSYTTIAKINGKGEWEYEYGVDSSRKVVAWQPFPKPYQNGIVS